jgi:hypothetical protein
MVHAQVRVQVDLVYILTVPVMYLLSFDILVVC